MDWTVAIFDFGQSSFLTAVRTRIVEGTQNVVLWTQDHIYMTFGPGELCSGGMLVLVGSELNGSWYGSDFTVQFLQCYSDEHLFPAAEWWIILET